MSIRTALIGTMLFIGAATTALIGIVGVLGISEQVRRQEQERVNYDLKLVRSHYEQRLHFLARMIEGAAEVLPLTDVDELQVSLDRDSAGV